MPGLLVIGGSDAGISGALRARELDPAVEIKVVVADDYPNFSICGLPFYLSGEITDWHTLAHRTLAELQATGVEFFLGHTARQIDPTRKRVLVTNRQGQGLTFNYNKLIIGTGAVPVPPPISGLDLPGVFPLHTMEESFALDHNITEKKPKSVLIVGSGYIGLEMADALTHRGLEVTLVGRPKAVLPTVDAGFGQLVEEELKRQGVKVFSGVTVERIETTDNGANLAVSGSKGFQGQAELVLVATGVRPNTGLVQNTGIKTGINGAICVDRKMRTNLPDIYAAGDCVETYHHLLERYIYLPLGTTSHKQGRVVGENVVGGQRLFQGTLGTQVVKVFNLVIARTGLTHDEALEAGYDPITTESKHWDHKKYYPNPKELLIRLTGDRKTGKLLGAQILGQWHSEISKRVDIFATALYHGMTIEELNDLDLSYTPPLSSPWDPVQMSAQAWAR
ncbi:MAG: FAD-dependent oxidoreductase [Chloroflexi bacterium]|nr:FAD-dependent oxidoreductase [Chloroflexota bacterium]OJV99095.1 MAG: CoA-disulfide reductase [Chloroflexi bacterium 54-19]